MAFLESLGSKTIAVFHELGAVILLLTASFKEINNFRGKESIKQCFDLGVMSFPIVALTLLFTGMVLSVQIAGRVLEREVKPEDHARMVEEFLSEVKQ